MSIDDLFASQIPSEFSEDRKELETLDGEVPTQITSVPEGVFGTNLGVFTLEHLIGEGGMGTVWRAVHREQNVHVAIKVLRPEKASQPKIREVFWREVQSVARLLHSGIVRIVDYGEVSRHASIAAPGILERGSPYIAMELATRGSLADLSGELSWTQLRWMLVEVLNALAHAHARDLVHRDLKPDNILLTEDLLGNTVLKLTDFGIAYINDPEFAGSTERVQSLFAGTPAYMSPEQLRGKWREFGPWTDLYSLGCVAFERCCGALPFEGETVYDIAFKQMHERPGSFNPKMPIPDGFEAWVRRLLEKSPRDRFTRAADAAWALAKLGDPEVETSGVVTPEVEGVSRKPTAIGDATWVLEPTPLASTQNTLQSGLTSTGLNKRIDPALLGLMYSDAPPIPETWHREHAPAPSIQLMGAGLGLYGVREIPFVGRVEERDAAWASLREMHKRRRLQGLVIESAAGLGKSRLAGWVAERAHELGVVTLLKTSVTRDARAPILSMIERHLKSTELAPEKTSEHLLKSLGGLNTIDALTDADIDTLTTLVRSGDSGEELEQDLSTRDTFEIVLKLLAHLCSERPVLLWFDDVHKDLKTLTLLEMFLTSKQALGLPIFLLMTCDAEVASPDELELITRFKALEHVETLSLGGLRDSELHQLIDNLLRVSYELRDEIVSMARGNPTFTVQLIGDWIQRDILVAGDSYYQLRDGSASFRPDTIDELWLTRLSHLIETVCERTGTFTRLELQGALEIAAILGPEISTRQWTQACTHAGLGAPRSLIEELSAQGFAKLQGSRWSFEQEQLRKRLLEQSRASPQWHVYHRACAAMLRGLEDASHLGVLQRRLHHLRQANALEEMVEPMLALIDAQQLQNDDVAAHASCEELETTLIELRTPEDDIRWGELKRRRATHLWRSKSTKDALKFVNHAVADAMVHRWLPLIGNLHTARAAMLIDAANFTEASRSLEQASEHMAELGDQLGLARSFYLLAEVNVQQRAFKRAADDVRACLDLYDGLPNKEDVRVQHLRGDLYLLMGKLYTLKQRYDRAAVALKRAEHMFQELRDHRSHAISRTWLGKLAMAQESTVEAAVFFDGARERLEQLALDKRVLPTLHRAILYLEAQSFDAAYALLQTSSLILQERGWAIWQPLQHAAMCCCHAAGVASQDWDDFALKTHTLLENTQVRDPDIALCLEFAADLFYDGEALERAQVVYTWAHEHWRRMGANEHARVVRTKLERTL